MAIPTDLDTPLEFLNEDGTVESKTFEDLANCWHQGQADDLAAGVTADQVKKFFDYIPSKVILPWLQALTERANVPLDLQYQTLRVFCTQSEVPGGLDATYMLQALSETAKRLGANANEIPCFVILKNGIIYNTPKEIAALGDLNWIVRFYPPEEYEKMKDAFGKALQSAEVVDNCLRLTFADGSTYTSASLKGDKGDAGSGGTGIPYTEVEALPEISEETKGTVYRMNGKFFAIQSVSYGNGSFKVGNKYGTIYMADGASDLLYGLSEGTYDLFDFDCGYTSGTVRFYAYPNSGDYYFILPGSEGGSMSIYSVSSDGLNTNSCYAGQSDNFEITGMTELGAKVFGGTVDAWKNFITGEEV